MTWTKYGLILLVVAWWPLVLISCLGSNLLDGGVCFHTCDLDGSPAYSCTMLVDDEADCETFAQDGCTLNPEDELLDWAYVEGCEDCDDTDCYPSWYTPPSSGDDDDSQ